MKIFASIKIEKQLTIITFGCTFFRVTKATKVSQKQKENNYILRLCLIIENNKHLLWHKGKYNNKKYIDIKNLPFIYIFIAVCFFVVVVVIKSFFLMVLILFRKIYFYNKYKRIEFRRYLFYLNKKREKSNRNFFYLKLRTVKQFVNCSKKKSNIN